MSLECCRNSMLFKASDACFCWSDDHLGVLFWVSVLLALFPLDLLLLAIFISDFWDKILLRWFIWLVMILAARVVSDTRVILPCSNSNFNTSLDVWCNFFMIKMLQLLRYNFMLQLFYDKNIMFGRKDKK